MKACLKLQPDVLFQRIPANFRTLVLHLPNSTGRFNLYSYTKKFATGSALYQIQNGKPKLVAYASKRLQEAARNYSITELELCGLAVNIASFVTY